MSNQRYNWHKKYWMYPGRWQPFHKGHEAIISSALKKGENVWIAIRETEISENNPYTAEQRLEMIKRAYGDLYGDKVIATVIPDIEGIRYGRKVGYKVEQVEVPKNIEKISATRIRAGEDNSLHERVANYINLLESTIWLTGLPCAGKTTIANRLEEEINNRRGYKTFRLDGDVVRGKGRLNEDLGFSYQDRKENLRRVANVARMFNETKTTVIASFVSPRRDLREMVKEIIGKDRFKLIYVKCPLEICKQRDTKGMYARARRGEIKEFTGVSAPYEEPLNPLITVNTHKQDLESCVESILSGLDI